MRVFFVVTTMAVMVAVGAGHMMGQGPDYSKAAGSTTTDTMTFAPRIFPEITIAQRFCGPKLTRTLGVVCNYRYNRAAGSRPRVSRGIIEECCEKECTLDQLRLYCL